MMRTYVLDANAVLDLVEEGPGSKRVRRIIQEAKEQHASIFVSVLNWGEVLYYIWQRRGEEVARTTIARLTRLPLFLVEVDLPQAMLASEIKAVHKIPYVDCVAAALAETRRATLVTSDGDFKRLGRRVSVLWIDQA